MERKSKAEDEEQHGLSSLESSLALLAGCNDQRAWGSVQGFSQGLSLLGPAQVPGGVSCLSFMSFTLHALGRGERREQSGGQGSSPKLSNMPCVVPEDHRGGQADS